ASVDGFEVAKEPAKVRESISLTRQFAAVDEILTGRENLVLIANCGTGRIRARSRMACGALRVDRRGRTDGVDVLGWHAPRLDGRAGPASPGRRRRLNGVIVIIGGDFAIDGC